MRVATFNVNGVNGRLPRLLEWLEETRPDIACLQEIKTGDATLPGRGDRVGRLRCDLARPARRTMASPSSRAAKRRARCGAACPATTSDMQARYLEADVFGLRIASVYLPNGNPQPGPKFDYKLAWFERLIGACAHADRSGDRDVVLAGDFNVVPTDADIYNAWLWRFDAVLQPETRARVPSGCSAQGWIDATRHLHPAERIYTFWVNANAFRRNAGFRMDFLLVSPHLAPRLIRTGVDSEHRGREKPSDHAPVWIEIDRPTELTA